MAQATDLKVICESFDKKGHKMSYKSESKI